MSLYSNSTASISIIRPVLDISVGMAVILGQIIALGRLPAADVMIIGFFIGFFISASSMVSNDIFDIEIDRINTPERILPAGRLSTKQAWGITITTATIGIILAFLLSVVIGIVSLLFALLGLAYNYRMKELGLPGNLIVSSSAIIPFVIGGLSVGGQNLLVWIVALITFFCNLSGELVGGIMDFEGDRVRNTQSVAMRIGNASTFLLANILLVIAMLLCWMPVLLDLTGMIYLGFAMVFTLILAYLVKQYYFLTNHMSDSMRLKKLKDLMFFAMMIGLPFIAVDVMI